VGFANRKSGSSSTPVGAIVGGVIGGVALIALIIGGFVYLRIRARKPEGDVFGEGMFVSEPKVEPFVYNPETESAQPNNARMYDAPNGLDLQSPAAHTPLLPPPAYEQSHASGSVTGSNAGESSMYTSPGPTPTTNLFPGRPQKN
jgi:hypothetical protein